MPYLAYKGETGTQRIISNLPLHIEMLSGAFSCCITIIWVLSVTVPNCIGKRQWEYEVISIVPFTSDESKLKIETQINRIGRGEFAFSAQVEWNYDMDDSTMVEGKGYRSSTGAESDYKLLPFDVPKQPYREFIDKYYEDLITNNLGQCSNMPRFEKFEPPWPKDTYVFDKCTGNTTGYPDFALDGFYKVVFQITGPVDWGFTFIVRIFNKFH